ncbi:thioredoxin family protein [Halarcobacter ebronensis]|uniref:Thioredoxin n=1 Tax=Halarcobacter ebronensis TaxID=1462615 RepID=A0A4Q1AXE6_9BACT|nr:thioredoxin domain-containing protein [Halarcobacter ebronensis]QKF83272.1 thioredoxin [Halarcobacter ebronensis]RXK05835.1 thioredoxin [Halarcobacter ebronensis]
MKKILLVLLFGFSTLFAIEHLNDSNFEEKLKGKNVIVDFYATWCPPCKIMTGILNEFEKEKPENVEVYKVDIDQYRDLAIKNGVKALPTLAYFQDGKLITLEVGIKSVTDLKLSSYNYFK